jgi:hypothetical protein
MKIKEIRSLIDLIRDASKAEIIIVSLFLLPILLASLSTCLNNISYLDQYDGWKFVVLIVIAAIYILGLIVMKWWDPRDEQLKRARLHVERRLERRSGHRASFEAIRDEVNEKYDDKFLNELIDKNPTIFHRVPVRRGKGKPYMDGIALN